MNELGWKSDRRKDFMASLMYKITHGLVPNKLIDDFKKTSSSQYLRSTGFSH